MHGCFFFHDYETTFRLTFSLEIYISFSNFLSPLIKRRKKKKEKKKCDKRNYRFYTNDRVYIDVLIHRQWGKSRLSSRNENISSTAYDFNIIKDVRFRVHSQLCGRHIPIPPFPRKSRKERPFLKQRTL